MAAVIQKITNNQKEFVSEGSNIKDLIQNIEKEFPGFKNHILTDSNEVHQFLNIYVNDEDIRFLSNLETAIKDGDVISFLPALAGGSF
ncbi:MAG: molybdopterin synthase sulfur carrier subunit [Chloroflexi bacterium]|jgi:molybdopterin synthase sulfur carrier subunit|nr:MAG: molybdopterin synthase sulfur carrier subunit [Chloroflexota bacterium]|tara:strand:+ start:162 stop:425 length:264 start_codon:yes stop_codon:yes gene_type:complete